MSQYDRRERRNRRKTPRSPGRPKKRKLKKAPKPTRDEKALEGVYLKAGFADLSVRDRSLHDKGAVRMELGGKLDRDIATVFKELKALREDPQLWRKTFGDGTEELFNTGPSGENDNDKLRFQLPVALAIRCLRKSGPKEAADALERIQAAVKDAVAVDSCGAGRVCSDMVLLISDPGCGAQQPHVDVPRLVGEELSAPNVALGAVFSLSPGGSRFDVALGTMGVQDRSRSRALRVVGTEAGPGGRVPRRRDAPRGGVRGVQPPHPRLSQHN